MWIIFLIIGIIVGILLKTAYSRTRANDIGFSVIRLSTPEVLETVAWVLKGTQVASAKPKWRLNSKKVRRIIFSAGRIFNYTRADLTAQLEVDSAHAFPVRNPAYIADNVASMLNGRYVEAHVVHDFDESVPKGKMSMVVLDGERVGLIFRRDVKRMGAKGPKRYRGRVSVS